MQRSDRARRPMPYVRPDDEPPVLPASVPKLLAPGLPALPRAPALPTAAVQRATPWSACLAWLQQWSDPAVLVTRGRPVLVATLACALALSTIALTTTWAGADSAPRLRPASAVVVPTRMMAPAAAVSAVGGISSTSETSSEHSPADELARDEIPAVALRAYRRAAARTAAQQPGCGLRWYLLAGIGRVESDHGRTHGATLHADGTSTPRIIGPALDGVHWAFVPAPPNGRALDGDARYAHALGPMQFIPTTWALYGADGDRDGNADVFDIDDSALGAAHYLCAAGGNLRTRSNQLTALYAYDHSVAYGRQVLAVAAAYREDKPVSDRRQSR